MAASTTLSPDGRNARARIGALSRSRTADDPDLIEARRDLHAARLAEHITKAVAGWPPLSVEQRDRLSVLLRPTDGAAA